MRTTLTIILLCLGMFLQAKPIKINYKTEIKPYYITIEKINNEDGLTLVYCKIKQFQRFSYSIEFADCAIITPNNPNGIKGELASWNSDKKIPFTTKPISDKKEESFLFAFTEGAITATDTFSIKLGTIQNKEKTELIVTNLVLSKKK